MTGASTFRRSSIIPLITIGAFFLAGLPDEIGRAGGGGKKSASGRVAGGHFFGAR